MTESLKQLQILRDEVLPKVLVMDIMLDEDVYEELLTVRPSLKQNTMRKNRKRYEGIHTFQFFGQWYWDIDYVCEWKDKLSRRKQSVNNE